MTADTMIDMPYLIRSLEQGLRAGYSLRQAVSRVAEDVAGLNGLANDLQDGRGVVESFADWAHTRPERDARLVVGAVRLQLEDEGNLADKFGAPNLLTKLIGPRFTGRSTQRYTRILPRV